MEDGPVPQLPAQRAGRPGGARAGAGAALDARVPRPARHPHAARLVSAGWGCGEGRVCEGGMWLSEGDTCVVNQQGWAVVSIEAGW